MFRILITQLLTVTAVLSHQLAGSWITEGYGLNPAVAYPLATMCILTPLVVAMFRPRRRLMF